MMPGAAAAVVEFLETLIHDDHDAPGDLAYGGPVIRVYIEEPDHAPEGRPTHRGPDGLHFYDIPVEDIDHADEPDQFVSISPFSVGEKQWVPYTGDRGGEGWQNVNTGVVSYDDEPPGEPLDPDDVPDKEIQRIADREGVTPEEVRNVLENLRGADATESDFVDVPSEIDATDIDDALEAADLGEPGMSAVFADNPVMYMDGLIEDADNPEDAADIVQIELNGGVGIDFIDAMEDAGVSEALARNIIGGGDGLMSMVGDDPDAELWHEDFANVLKMEGGMDHDTAMGVAEDIADSDGVVDLSKYSLPTEKKEAMTNFVDDVMVEEDQIASETDLGVFTGFLLDEGADIPEFPDSPEELPEVSASGLADWLVENGARPPPEYGNNPFKNHDADLDPSLDPSNANSVVSLEEVSDSPGRSAESMYIAKGVPDGEGGEHRLFVTNTNSARGFAQGAFDGGDRCVGGQAGFEEAGFNPPRYERVEGEFWVSEELEGEPAADSSWNDIADNPETASDKMTDLFAPAMVLGAWDMHGDNVFVTDEGEMEPVDLDLAGCELHDDVGWDTDNPYSTTQTDAWRRFEGLWRGMGMDETDADWEDAVDETVRKVREMGENGEARDIVSAATSDTESLDIEATMEENMFAIESGDFFSDGTIERVKKYA
jgi:hypothetical protein